LDLYRKVSKAFPLIRVRIGRVVWGVNFVVKFVVGFFVFILYHQGIDDSFLLKSFSELVEN